MCQINSITKGNKGKHLKYSERLSIERWWNRDKRSKVCIAGLLDRNEKTIRNEIKRGLVTILTSELKEKTVYSADVAQQKYNYYLRLIRRFIPKGTDINTIPEKFIDQIQTWINNYPRAIFNYKTSYQLLSLLCV